MKVHDKTRAKTQCSHCPKMFFDRLNLIQHHKDFHPNALLSLDDIIWNPITPEFNEGQPICDICGKAFKRLENIKYHMAAAHSNNRRATIKCEQCPKVFCSKSNFSKHVKKHAAKIGIIEPNEQGPSCTQHDEKNTPPKKRKYFRDHSYNDNDVRQNEPNTGVSKRLHSHTPVDVVDVMDITDSVEFQMLAETIAPPSPSNPPALSNPFLIDEKGKEICEKKVDFSLPDEFTILDTPYKFVCLNKNIYSNMAWQSLKLNPVNENGKCDCKANDKCGDSCINRNMNVECNPEECPCGKECQNKRMQNQKYASVVRFKTKCKGFGLKAKEDIKKNTLILEYIGEVVHKSEFEERMRTLYKNDCHHYGLKIDKKLVIDSFRKGNDARYVNHSCQSNSEMQLWIVNGLKCAGLFASCDIKNGDEITYDYKFTPFSANMNQECHCESQMCRGSINIKSHKIKQKSLDNSTGIWPNSLHRHADLCFAKCTTSSERNEMETYLRFRSNEAQLSGQMWKIDWDKEPVPSIDCSSTNGRSFSIRSAETAASSSKRMSYCSIIRNQPLFKFFC